MKKQTEKISPAQTSRRKISKKPEQKGEKSIIKKTRSIKPSVKKLDEKAFKVLVGKRENVSSAKTTQASNVEKCFFKKFFSNKKSDDRIEKKIIAKDIIEGEKNVSCRRKCKRRCKLTVGIGVVAALVAIMAISFDVFFKHQNKQSIVSTDNAVEENVLTDSDIVNTIKSTMNLPQDEEPTMLTILDRNNFKGKTLFINVENGDKVLLYAKASLAILYNPTSKEVTGVSSLDRLRTLENNSSSQTNVAGASNNQNIQNIPAAENVDEITPSDKTDAVSAESVPVVDKNITVAVYNGSNTKGLAAVLAEKVATQYGIKISGKSNAFGNYDKNTVIDLSKKNKETASVIANFIGGDVAPALPASETAPKADILIIASHDINNNVL